LWENCVKIGGSERVLLCYAITMYIPETFTDNVAVNVHLMNLLFGDSGYIVWLDFMEIFVESLWYGAYE
jgi:hypothetical protein